MESSKKRESSPSQEVIGDIVSSHEFAGYKIVISRKKGGEGATHGFGTFYVTTFDSYGRKEVVGDYGFREDDPQSEAKAKEAAEFKTRTTPPFSEEGREDDEK